MLPVLALAATVQAQELTLHEGWLVEPEPDTPYANGIGSPAVAYDDATDTWVMFYETQFAPSDGPGGNCRDGHWGVGRFTSSDGLNWTADGALVLLPAEGTYYDCVVAHPAVLFDGTTWHLWFKAQQSSNACADTDAPEPSWGCRVVTGVGYARSTDGVTWEVSEEPVLALSSFGFPTVAKVDDVWHMLVSYNGGSGSVFKLWESLANAPEGPWSPPTMVVEPGFADWAENEVYNPSLACTDDGPFPYVLWAGGRNSRENPPGPPVLETAGLGRAVSTDGTNYIWDPDSPYVQWNLDAGAGPVDRDWRHWDVVRVGDDWLIFFSVKDDANRNRIGLAYTFPEQQTGFDEQAVSDRVCGDEVVDTEPPETDLPEDTDPADTEPPATGETDDTGEAEELDDGCNCATTSAAPPWALGLLLLALGRRRR